MTPFGYLLLALLIVSLFFKFKYTLALLVVSCIFMNTTVVNFGGKIVQPYLLCSAFVILRTMLRCPKCQPSGDSFMMLLLFCVYSAIITLFGPVIFEGITVLDKNIDSSIATGGMSLHFGMYNITQLGYLLLNCTTLYCVWRKRTNIKMNDLKAMFLLTTFIAVAFGLWEFSSKTVGVYFPSDFFFNAADEKGWLYTGSVYGYLRLSSVFGESSYCGAFMASAFWGIIGLMENEWNWKYFVLLLGVFICLVLGISGSGVTAFCFGGAVYALFVKKLKIKYILLGIIIALGLFAIVSAMHYWDIIIQMLTEKSESTSGINRSTAIFHSLGVFFETYAIGCGMGSTRSSSLIADLLAGVGLIGTFCFACFYYKFVKLRFEYRFVFLYIITMFAAQAVAIPDFSFCSFWLMMYIGAALNITKYRYEYIKRPTGD